MNRAGLFGSRVPELKRSEPMPRFDEDWPWSVAEAEGV